MLKSLARKFIIYTVLSLVMIVSLAGQAYSLDLCSENVDITIAADEYSYDNQSITIDGCTLTINGTHTFQNITWSSTPF